MARPAKYNWEKIRIDFESGLTPAEIHKKHDVPYNRLSEQMKKWEVSEQARFAIKGFDEVSEVITELKGTNPALAQNVIDIITQKNPEFKKAMATLSGKLFTRMIELSNTATASDVQQIAKGMQTVTDTLGISQRHANQSNTVNVQTNTAVQTNINREDIKQIMDSIEADF